MLVALGFLCASLIALSVVPALNRRADRLARKRAEAAFPLSLAEIAADRDHLRAELALRARTVEQEAERAFAAKAAAMQDLGRRDMKIGELDGVVRERDGRIAGLETDLESTRDHLSRTQAALVAESGALAETRSTLEQRLADLASLERDLAETRGALTGTSADLATRDAELASERDTRGRTQALLAERETELAQLRLDYDQIRVAQVEDRTKILVLEAKASDLADRLAAKERDLVASEAALSATKEDRDSERLRADALAARAAQAEAGLAAADARSVSTGVEAARLDGLLAQEIAAHAGERESRQALEQEMTQMKVAHEAQAKRDSAEIAGLRQELSARSGEFETVHAELQTLQGALEQSRAERARLQRAATVARKTGVAAPTPGPEANAALRREIMAVAERLMNLPPQQEAAE